MDVWLSSISWGDYNNDGFFDVILTGYNGNEELARVYKNEGDGSFTEASDISLVGAANNSTSFLDYDNDGLLDIFVSGDDNYIGTKLYKNLDGNTFLEVSTTFRGLTYGDCIWGDYDNDNDWDVLFTGWSGGEYTQLYKNNSAIPNTVPTSPTNLQVFLNGNDVTFTWDKAYDNETPQNSLTYNLAIGTSPGSVDVLSPMADRITGYRRVVRSGNSQTNNWIIKDLPDGEYYWSVQAIDAAFAGSEFAEEQNFSMVIPVELISFDADIVKNSVSLHWATATETNNKGFELQRKSNKNEWEKIKFIEGKGTTTEISNYKYIDELSAAGKYSYRLKQIDLDGTASYSKTIEINVIPQSLSLEQNYPNPFNPSTSIEYSVKSNEFVTLKVYGVLGNVAATLVNEEKPAGNYEIRFDASSLSSGIYFYQLKAGDFLDTRKMMLVK